MWSEVMAIEERVRAAMTGVTGAKDALHYKYITAYGKLANVVPLAWDDLSPEEQADIVAQNHLDVLYKPEPVGETHSPEEPYTPEPWNLFEDGQ
jgi:hypothetical protein